MANFRFLGPGCEPDALTELGGKGQGLWRLAKAGLPVPAWICVPASVFRQAIQPVCSEEPASLLQALKLPDGFEKQLNEALNGLGGTFFAVRSSATGEDQANHSFAGLFRTWLQVSADEVAERVLDCWREAFSPAVLAYTRQNGLETESLDMAVIIQVQIAADCAGILFQASPDGNLNDQVIVAGYGLGEGIVSAQVESDSYLCDRFNGIWRETIACKTRCITAGPQGPVIASVPAHLQNQAVLNQAQRLELLSLADKCRPDDGRFQDIEWCRQGEQWFILQSRPITTLPPAPYLFFDSSNIQESYPGVVLPLTASLVQRGYGTNFSTTLRKLGFSKQFLAQRQHVLQAMTAQFEGRLYYHMQHWTTVLQWLPGARRLALQSFAAMISRAPATPVAAGHELWLGLRLYPILLWRLLSLNGAMKRYRRLFLTHYGPFNSLDPETLSFEELIGEYDKAFTRFLPMFYVPLLNDLWTGLVSGLLRRLLHSRLGEPAEALFHDLMADLAGLESALPLQAVAELAKQVEQSPELQDLLAKHPPEQAWEACASELEFAGFYRQLQIYLQDYGGRSLQELKLEVSSFHEEPWRLLSLIHSQAGIVAKPSRGRELRLNAEARLKQLWPWWSYQKSLCLWLLNASRRALLRREAGRLDRTRLMAAARRIFLAAGRQLHKRGWLERPRDIFYLRQEELLDMAAGVGFQAQVCRQIVQERQVRFAGYADRHPCERLLMPALAGDWAIPQQSLPEVGAGLKGIGCAGGVAVGEVLIVDEPSADLDVTGKILLTLSTDPGWVFLMARAEGLITEQGNLLSHAAILARELGLPTVVGLAGITRILKNGEKIRIDGRTGLIERLDNQTV